MVAQSQSSSRTSPQPWSLQDELAVRTMLLVDHVPPKRIAEVVNRPIKSVRNLIERRGWAKDRAIVRSKAEALLQAKANEHALKIVDAVGTLAEEASLGALMRAKEATQRTDKDAARDFRSWAGGARDLVMVSRQARGLDAGPNAQGNAVQVNLFSVNAVGFGVPSEPKRAQAAEAVEIEAKPAQTTASDAI